MNKHGALQSRFTELFSAESETIFRFCLIRVSNHEQALDIVQETFLRLWRKLQEGMEITNPRAFLFAISHNLIIDWYRKKKALPFSRFEEEEADEPPDETTIDNNVERQAEGRYIIDRIHKIRAPYQYALYLRYVEGLSPFEIGRALDIRENTASVRVHRGLRELRRITGYGFS